MKLLVALPYVSGKYTEEFHSPLVSTKLKMISYILSNKEIPPYGPEGLSHCSQESTVGPFLEPAHVLATYKL
jgi:hypothetical protein